MFVRQPLQSRRHADPAPPERPLDLAPGMPARHPERGNRAIIDGYSRYFNGVQSSAAKPAKQARVRRDARTRRRQKRRAGSAAAHKNAFFMGDGVTSAAAETIMEMQVQRYQSAR